MDENEPVPQSFFLGGNDLEMETIRGLLRAVRAEVHDDRLTWGAKASHYGPTITDALARGLTPALVELEADIPLPADAVVIVDHHGALAGADAATSLEQVFALLGLPASAWTREFELVAANDRGHIDGLVRAGATRDEIIRIRRADRTAQGVSGAEEREAADAVARAERPAEGLTIVRLPHARTAPVADALHPALGGPGYDCLVVTSPGEINVFADGATIARLDAQFPGGWKGGSLPERGFWGRAGDSAAVEEWLLKVGAAA